jgi:hypothetical protein
VALGTSGTSGWASRHGLRLRGHSIYTLISKYFGKRHAMGAVLIMAIAPSSHCSSTTRTFRDAAARLRLRGLTGAGFWTIYNSMLADIMDYDELETASAARVRSRHARAGSPRSASPSAPSPPAGSSSSRFRLRPQGQPEPGGHLLDPLTLSAIPVFFLAFAVWAIASSRDARQDGRNPPQS